MWNRVIVTSLTMMILTAAGCALDGLRNEASEAMKRSLDFYRERQTGGGWATAYSIDLKVQWGEWRPVAEDVVAVQPPGTPTVAGVFLRAYRVLGEETHLDVARQAADLLLRGQQPNGGFSFELMLSDDGPVPVWQAERLGPPLPYGEQGSLEDDVTDAPIGFFLDMFDATGDSIYFQAARRGVDFMVKAQYPSGGWPQVYPPPANAYARYYTINDGVVSDTILRLLDFYRRSGEQIYLETAVKGGRWLISAQLGAPTYGWAEQYDLDMKPAKARAFEPPSISPRATSLALQSLLALHLETGDDAFLEPFTGAVDWLEQARVAEGLWVYLYDAESGEPIFMTRDGRRYHDCRLMEESDMLRWWFGSYGLPPVIDDWRRIEEMGRDRFREWSSHREVDMKSLGAEVIRVLEEQRPEGFWIQNGQINGGAFARSAGVLLAYLEETS